MFKLKRILSILLVIALLVAVMPAFAQSRYGIRTSDAVQTSTALVLPAKTWVYGIKIFADAGNSFAGIYDVATLGAANYTNVVDEIGEATQYDSAEIKYAKPKYFANGVTVVMTTGVFFIDYGPEPTN